MGDELVIPQWAIFLGGGVVPWLIWLTLRSFRNATQISVLLSTLDGINKSLTDARVEFRVSFDKIEGRLDTFLSDELKFLKEQLKQNK